MEALPARARAYVVCVTVPALLCLLPLAPSLPVSPQGGVQVSWWAVAPLAALYAGCERLARSRPVAAPHPGGVFHPVLLAAAFLLPPSAAALVALPGALLLPVEQRPYLARRIWRAGRLVLAVWAAGSVHLAVGGREAVADCDVPGALGTAGAAVLVFCLVLTLLEGGILALTSGMLPRGRRVSAPAAWWRLFLGSLAPLTVHGLAGLMMALLWRSPYGPVAALLVLLPMGVSSWAFAQYHRERAAHQATIRALVQAVDIKDGYTRGHSERVGRASMMIARELGMDDERVELLRFAGILHDVGKLGVPTRLLTKNGPLTPEERRVIELHPEYGHEMVRGISFLGEARAAVLHHHERLDGSGYPYGLAGGQIPESARVVAVADAFDAMTSNRSYSRARPVQTALDELRRCAGAHFDPRMVAALVRAITRSGWHPAVTADEPAPPTAGAFGAATRGARAADGAAPASHDGTRTATGTPAPAGDGRVSGVSGAPAGGRSGGAAMRPRLHAVVRLCAAGLAVSCLGITLYDGVEGRGPALAFGVLITLGEFTRRTGTGIREAAPLAAAGSLSYALVGEIAGRPTQHGAAQVVAVVLAASLLGSVPHVGRGDGPALDSSARRVLTVGFVALCFQPLYNRGTFDGWGGPAHAVLLLALLSLTALCEAVLAAALAHSRTGRPFPPALRDELRALPGIGAAVIATGAVMALGVAVVGLWALPVFSVPLLLAQLSYRRYAAVRATYRQTITSLARATEIAGCTPAGHARRVAELGQAVGRDLGLSEPELTVLEYAALMHDIGQLSLVDPVPAGATAGLPVEEQRRIALLGGAVVRQTGVDPRVAAIVERQADPYREQPLAARIVRVVNAYEEKSREGGPGGPLTALEELRLGAGGAYAPDVVEALARVLSRNTEGTSAHQGRPWRGPRTGASDPGRGWVTHG